ncbi:MAG: hypothetical protein J6O23_01445 [Prevotella sp.]|nr:hypothetical protein [Prevotella sp.]
MKIKKEYIRPTIEILSSEMQLLSLSVNTPGKNDGTIDDDDRLDARQNTFTFTDEDSDDDW